MHRHAQRTHVSRQRPATRRVTRSAGVLLTLALLLSTLSSMAPTPASAEVGPRFDFEDFTPGVFDEYRGWVSPLSYDLSRQDHEIVEQSRFPSMGTRVLRMSDAGTEQTLTRSTVYPILANEAGETAAVSPGGPYGSRKQFFVAEFDVASATSTHHGTELHISADGANAWAPMSELTISDASDGLAVRVASSVNGTYTESPVISGLSRDSVHHLRWTVLCIDGPSNDIVTVTVNGQQVFSGRSLEGYLGYGDPMPRAVNTIKFWGLQAGYPNSLGKGFYFDDVRVSTGHAPASTTNVVLSLDEEEWDSMSASNATGETVTGPSTPPLGSGSARLETTSESAPPSMFSMMNTGYLGTPLSEFTALSYSSYAELAGECREATFVINVDHTGNQQTDDVLNFYPCMQSASDVPPGVTPQPEPGRNAWQEWDAWNGAWAVGGDDGLTTIDAYLNRYPNATIADRGLWIRSGSGVLDGASVVYVDAIALTVNGTETIYDFEPDTVGPIVTRLATEYVDVSAPGTYSFEADISDATNGGASIASAAYTINNGDPIELVADDGAFNEIDESVSFDLTNLGARRYTVCVFGRDSLGNTGEATCPNLNIANPVGSTTTQIVDSLSADGWSIAAAAPDRATLVGGPGMPPTGTDSLRMRTGPDVGEPLFAQYLVPGATPLSHLSALSYSTYSVSAAGCALPRMVLALDLTNSGIYDATLEFNPCLQTGSEPGDTVPLQGPPTLNTWQTWDAHAGGWRIRFKDDHDFRPSLLTLDSIFNDYPLATIWNSPDPNLLILVGGRPDVTNYEGYLDAVTIGINATDTVFDFERPVDTAGPVVTTINASPNPAVAPTIVQVTATISDLGQGDRPLASAVYTTGSGAPRSLTPVDGVWDEPTEDVAFTLTNLAARTHTICVRGTDISGFTGPNRCVAITVTAPPPVDIVAPTLSDLTATPNPVRVGQNTVISVNVDDTATGNSTITSAQYRIGTGSWQALLPADGRWDEASETAQKALSFNTPGTYTVCVRATDRYDNRSAEQCTIVYVLNAASAVSGSGQFTSPRNALVSRPTYTGRASFSIQAAYASQQATTPTGSFSLQLTGTTFRFQSTTLTSLTTTTGGGGALSGSGTLNGGAGYSFSVTFDDNGTGTQDKLRIRIWNTSTNAVVYDSQPGQTTTVALTIRLTSGNLTVTP